MKTISNWPCFRLGEKKCVNNYERTRCICGTACTRLDHSVKVRGGSILKPSDFKCAWYKEYMYEYMVYIPNMNTVPWYRSTVTDNVKVSGQTDRVGRIPKAICSRPFDPRAKYCNFMVISDSRRISCYYSFYVCPLEGNDLAKKVLLHVSDQ